MTKKVAFATLGCKLNYAETSYIERDFITAGYEVVKPQEIADVYVVNTCSVTEHSDKKCRNYIRKFHKQNAEAKIAVIGCYAQLKPEEISKIEGVSVVLGADKKGTILKELESLQSSDEQKVFKCDISCVENVFPAFSTGERTRSFLKVQDGCDYRCSYCTIPLARGKSRNMPISLLVKEAEKIAATGIKEIVLTGVNTGDFGKTTGESFLSLLKALNEVNGIERYRISSIEPNLLTEEIVSWIASGTKFLPHFHIPLQSGSDEVLAKMRRRYNTKIFREKVALIRSKMKDVFFGIDVIVGFPGETDECFEDTYRFLEEIRPSFIHTFPYSRRKDTDAAVMANQVDENIKNQRVARLMELSDRLHQDFYNSNIGKIRPVLFESKMKGGMMYGYSDNYLRIEQKFDSALIGKIIEVEIL